VIPVSLQVAQTPALPRATTAGSGFRLLLLAAITLGLLLVLAAALPSQVLRPAVVHEVVVVHRLDLAFVGTGIVLLIGTIYLVAG